jgi:hypothetical protein
VPLGVPDFDGDFIGTSLRFRMLVLRAIATASKDQNNARNDSSKCAECTKSPTAKGFSPHTRYAAPAQLEPTMKPCTASELYIVANPGAIMPHMSGEQPTMNTEPASNLQQVGPPPEWWPEWMKAEFNADMAFLDGEFWD